MKKKLVRPRYEYVASALNFVGCWEHQYVDRELIASWFGKINNLHDHYVSVLFNAYTEQDKADMHRKLTQYPGTAGPQRVYADSGGLQMVSLGIGQITPALKQTVYETQATYSDVAMIFDQIPIWIPPHQAAQRKVTKEDLKKSGINSNGANALNRASRYFDPDLLVPCAKETAQNMLDQIKHFDKVGCDTKTICILQGNSVDDYQKWFDTILLEIPKEEWFRIGGVAFGTPMYGNGQMEDIERAFFINDFDAPDHIKKHIHLLGIGSVSRMMPNVIFRRNGVIKDDVLISYDSSKHTGGTVRGQFQLDFDMIQVLRSNKRGMEKLDGQVLSFAEHILKFPMDRDKLHDVILMSKNQLTERYGEGPMTRELFVQYRFVMLMFSIYQVSKAMDRCHSDTEYLTNKFKNQHVMGLHEVTTKSQLQKWKAGVKSAVPSKRAPSKHDFTSLEGFFA